MKDEHRIRVILTPEQFKDISAASDLLGLKVAQFIRMAALEKANKDE